MIETNDEYLEYFFEFMGKPTTLIPANQPDIEKYRGRLPDQLLEYWQLLGFSGFADGLFWLTNPAEYQDILDRLLEDTLFEQQDIYYVIARNAWGELQLFGEKTGRVLSISAHLNWIIIREGDEKALLEKKSKLTMQKFLVNQEPDRLDIKNIQGKPMFPAALKKHGPLAPDEVYGFAPFLFAGGEKKISNIEKCNIFNHLNLIADMGEMEIIDMASLVSRAIENNG
ncbi:TPA: DUF1851 domain-containing protein [Vibrio vulnificus]|nr:DUF1851 domain-containing protein [Vibrio vulnificus]HAS6253818.1 DUF1851 domain-containing protein [Vibrio vulnificus]